MPPNPFRDPGPWGRVTIGGYLVPGIVSAIDGAEKPEEWNVQKGSAGNNAVTVWKGTKLAESIKITVVLATETAFDDYAGLVSTLRPKIGEKPPSLAIESPILAANGITRVAVKNIGQPKPRADLAWTVEIELIEYNPAKPAAAGQASPAKPPDAPEQTPEEKAFAAALDAASKAGQTP